MKKAIKKTNKKSADLYGDSFDTQTFYSVIAQNTNFIKQLNDTLETYGLHIDYYSRIKDFTESWIVDTLYIPMQ
jgi:hypothetical protein